MIKKAVVEVGKTPSVLSGAKSTLIDTKTKEALVDKEKLKSIKKASEAMSKIIENEK